MKKNNTILFLLFYILIFVIINYIPPSLYNETPYYIIALLPVCLILAILSQYKLILYNNKYGKVWKYVYLKSALLFIAQLGVIFEKQKFQTMNLEVMNTVYIFLFILSGLVEYRMNWLLNTLQFSLKHECSMVKQVQETFETGKYRKIEQKFSILGVVFFLLGIFHLNWKGFYICAMFLVGISYMVFSDYIKHTCSFGVNKRKLAWSCYANYMGSILVTMILYEKLHVITIFICLYSGFVAKYYWNCRIKRTLYYQL